MDSKKEIKQVIVMRQKFLDVNGNMSRIRTGKYVAQGGHGVISFLSNRLKGWSTFTVFINRILRSLFGCVLVKISEEEWEWFDESYAKICCKVDSEDDLWYVYIKAKEAGLTVHMVTDSGRTEFAGVETNTCLVIGPHYSHKIDPITGHLELM